jgi:hypothetical protein
MCLKRKLFILSIFVVLFPLPINAVSWEVYFKDNNGFEYFIDKDSVHKTPKGTFLVRHQLIFSKTGEIKWGLHKSHFLYEIDCSRKRYKYLKGENYSVTGVIRRIKEKGDWRFFEPKEADASFYRKICEPKKE